MKGDKEETREGRGWDGEREGEELRERVEGRNKERDSREVEEGW